VVVGATVVVVCPRCQSGVEAPLSRQAGPPPETSLTVARAVEMGCVLIDAGTLAELTAAYLIESAFAGMSGEEP
jgi:hypothetical protein